ncbi:MAG TPA: hypothetical protein VMU07_02690, partial [Candidatus Paceibacterota bacterium]|nr:hypothetical protein [Candidatus Paceibacterota bacterium]
MKLRKKFSEYKERAIELRKEGNTYKDIRTSLNVPVSKSTLSTWFSDVLFSIEEKEKIAARCIERIRLGNKKALETKKIARDKYLQEIRKGLVPLGEYLNNSGVQKIVLIALYWCEGAKRRAGSLSFGNSDPELIRLFLKLMRSCYPIEEGKFRCTVLCRADQNTEELKLYWSKITMISP